MVRRMESFWLAETLKYTYMLQLDTKDSIDLTKYGDHHRLNYYHLFNRSGMLVTCRPLTY